MTLPRELRDEIYGALGHDIEVTPSPSDDESPARWPVMMFMKSGPIAALFRVSKQFSGEYKQQIQKVSALAIKDLRSDLILGSEVTNLPLVQIMRHTRQIELYQSRWSEEGLRKVLEGTFWWVAELKALSSDVLKFQVVVEVSVLCTDLRYPDALPPTSSGPEFDAIRDANAQLIEGLTRVEGMGSVEVRWKQSSEMLDGRIWHLVYGKWTKKQGWVPGPPEKVERKKLLSDNILLGK